MSAATVRHGPARTPLAAALAAVLAAGSLVAATSVAGTGRKALRDDPARRIIPVLGPAGAGIEPGPAAPATIVVENCNDDGPGSLRAAVAAAAEGDTIDLVALACGTITLATGAIPVLLDSLTFDGPGAGQLAIDGGDVDRVLIHPGTGQLVIRDLTIRHGRDRATGFDLAGGGCIASAGYVTLDHARVTECYAGGEGAYGGALYAYSLTMLASTMSANVAYGIHDSAGTAAFGGGAFVYAIDLVDSTVTGNRAWHRDVPPRTSYDIGGGIISVRGGFVSGSTIDSNTSAQRGGGIATFGDLAVSNSTISGNVASLANGGGLLLRNPASLLMFNSTIAYNAAATGGGGALLSSSGAVMQSTLVSGNTSAAGGLQLHSTYAGVVVTGANDLVSGGGGAIELPPDTLIAPAGLLDLAANGGPTRTQALGPDSPAIDAGNNFANFTDDQRGAGFPRVRGAAADIGAYERDGNAAPTPPAPVPADSPTALAVLGMLLAILGFFRRHVGARAGLGTPLHPRRRRSPRRGGKDRS